MLNPTNNNIEGGSLFCYRQPREPKNSLNMYELYKKLWVFINHNKTVHIAHLLYKRSVFSLDTRILENELHHATESEKK